MQQTYPHVSGEEIKLKPGDRVVFLGDSITQAGVRPGGYVDLFRQAVDEHFGQQEITVIGAGISGNKVPDLQRRLQKDVLDQKPTVVVIYIGINDVWHSTRGQGTAPEAFQNGLKEIIEKIEASDAKVMLCTPSVIGEKAQGHNSLDEMLDQYADISRTVAKDTGVMLLDLRQDFLDKLGAINPDQKPHSILTTDGVHLNAAGNLFVARTMAKALGVPEKDQPTRLLRHLVLFKFKEDAGQDKIDEVVQAFADLPGKIEAIHEFEKGVDVSVEGKAKGFTHGFLVTFRTEADRQIYLPHPAHKTFVELVGPIVDDVLVFDYWTTE
jgi:lysophospholipase L1-like esterase